LYRLVVMIHDL